MNARTARLSGLGTLLAVSVAFTSGCGAATRTETPTVSVATPRDEILKSVPDASAAAYHFVIKGGTQPLTGVLDSGKKSLQINLSQSEPNAGFTLDMKFLLIDKDAWTKISFTPANLAGLPKLPKKWQLLDPAKIKDKDNSPLAYEDETDPGYVSSVVQASAGLAETTKGHFAGTTDLTQSTDAQIVDEKTLKALGEKAKTVPFTAVVDASGHFSTLTLKIPAAGKTKAQTYAVTYDGYGSTDSPTAPAAGEQQKAVAAVYDMLNG